MKEFRKSVKIWLSYCREFNGFLFIKIRCVLYCCCSVILLSINDCCDFMHVHRSDSSKFTGSDARCTITWLGDKSCMSAVYLLVDAAAWQRYSWPPGEKDSSYQSVNESVQAVYVVLTRPQFTGSHMAHVGKTNWSVATVVYAEYVY